MSIKLFSRWEASGIKVLDPGLQKYINFRESYLPRSSGRSITTLTRGNRHLVDRLITKLMVPGHKGKKHTLTSYHATGKYNTCYKIVEKTFFTIEKRLGKNPVEVFVTAVENAAPREEITTIEYGGARYPKAVECAPLRRVDLALRHMIQGAYSKSFNSKKHSYECLAEEIILAYQLSPSSNAISKKNEAERQADSSR